MAKGLSIKDPFGWSDGLRNDDRVLFRSPDNAAIKQKMLYSSSKDALRRAFGEGIAKEIQANDHGDLQWQNVLDICKKTDRD